MKIQEKKRKPLNFMYKGKKRNITELLEMSPHNIPYHTLYQRLIKLNMPVSEAINLPPPRFVNYAGKMISIRELLKYATNGITYRGLYYRINSNNYTIQEALTSPLENAGRPRKQIVKASHIETLVLSPDETNQLNNYLATNNLELKDVLLSAIHYKR